MERNNGLFAILGAAAFAVASLTAPVRAFGSTTYTFTTLASTLGIIQPFALNNNGQVVGQIVLPTGDTHAFSWTITSGIIDLGVLAGDEDSTAIAVNDSGHVTGYSQTADDRTTHGFIWQSGVGLANLASRTPLSLLPRDINSDGRVTGTILNGTFPQGSSGFVYVSGGIIPAIVPGYTVADVEASNERGQMAVRTTETDNVVYYAPGGAAHQITAGNLTSGAAMAINNNGTVVGYIDPSDGRSPHAYAWNDMTGLTDLTPGMNSSGIAQSINDFDQIVGTASLNGGKTFPFLYQDGNLLNLSTLVGSPLVGWTDINPEAINDNGQIAGFGIFNGQQEAFLLTPTITSSSPLPTPEPTTLPLLLTAALPLLRRHPRKSP